MILRLLSLVAFASLAACTSGQCRRDGTPVVADDSVKTISEEQLANEIIVIGKSDNSLQCGYNVGITLEAMSKELEGMKILKSEKKHDGLMRIQSCGAPTGMMNVYSIYRKDAKKAVKMGYKVLESK
ncbi:MAG: hypothetical protein IT287_09730 [Bdellovibrionaceae bacterium]|nr:hypothetical protein [Pseudobdellovibrionaceae bacterium]